MRPKSIGDNRVLVGGWDTAGKGGTKQTMELLLRMSQGQEATGS